MYIVQKVTQKNFILEVKCYFYSLSSFDAIYCFKDNKNKLFLTTIIPTLIQTVYDYVEQIVYRTYIF